MKPAKTKSPPWLVHLKHSTGKTKTLRMPGGLHEAEAARCAVLKAGLHWRLDKQPEREETASNETR